MAASVGWGVKQAAEVTRNGNHVVVRASGTGVLLAFGETGAAVTRVQNATSSISTGAHEISELGDPDPQEIVDGLHRYSITIDSLTLRKHDVVGVINAGEVDITISDNYGGDNKDVKRFVRCRLADERISVPKHGEVARGLTFLSCGEI